MMIATVRYRGVLVPAVVDPESRRAWPIDGAADVLDLVRNFAKFEGPLQAVRSHDPGVSLDDVTIAAPIPRPLRNVFCVGKNYYEHAREFGSSGFDTSAPSTADAIPTDPIVFTKVPESVIADGDAIRFPEGISDCVDYEAELAVVIGKEGRGIRRDTAYDYVFGYTIVNDVTARDWQARHKQWFLGKSFDTFCPMGPWIVTSGDLDAANLDVRCWVNDELRQHANTRDLIFDIPTLIETISAGITLYPGDIISTGTPAGVGIGFKPPRPLQRGDTVRIEIERIGRLTNSVA